MIIPAKGHSTRIHEKNLKLFCGLPMVEWSIIQGTAARTVDEVWVSTEDRRVAALAIKHGAKVHWRGYADNDETPAFVPVDEWIKKMFAEELIADDDGVIVRLCTTPHLKPNDVDQFTDMFWLNLATYNARGLGVGAEARTHICSRKIARGVDEGIPEATCHNDSSIVHHLTFMGMMRARALAGHEAVDKPDTVNTEGPNLSYYYTFDEWQFQDCDTMAEWEFGELVMEHYILKGRTAEEVYGTH